MFCMFLVIYQFYGLSASITCHFLLIQEDKLGLVIWCPYMEIIHKALTYSVSSSQIDSEPSSSRTQQEHKDVRASLEISHHVSPVWDLGRAVQPHVGVFPVPHVLLKGNNITCFISQYKHNMILLFLQKALLAIICPNKDFLGCQKEIWKLFFIF